MKILSENPETFKSLKRLQTETNLSQAYGEDNLKLYVSAGLRSMDVAETQRVMNDPVVNDYYLKMLKGLSM